MKIAKFVDAFKEMVVYDVKTNKLLSTPSLVSVAQARTAQHEQVPSGKTIPKLLQITFTNSDYLLALYVLLQES